MSAMAGLTALVLIINLLLLGYGLYQLKQLQARLAAVDSGAQKTLPLVRPAAESLRGQLQQQAPAVIAIEILNPMEIAKSRSKLAGPLSSFSPNLIRNRVYDQASEIIKKQLGEQGVQASVSVVRQGRDRA